MSDRGLTRLLFYLGGVATGMLVCMVTVAFFPPCV